MKPGIGTRASLVHDYFRSTVPYWDDVYDDRSLTGELYRVRAQAVLDLVASTGRDPEGTRVLEIGCGAGRTSVALARMGYSVDAVDIVPEMIGRVSRRAALAGVSDRIRAATGDVNRLAFGSEVFDLVLAVGVLEWSATLDGPLREMARVIRPGGHLIVNVDNALALHCLADPRLHPLTGGLKRALRPTLEKIGMLPKVARPGRCPPWRLDSALARSGMRKIRGLTCGFGPFTLLGRRVIPDRLGLRLHFALQRRADQGIAAIRSGGETYLTLSERK